MKSPIERRRLALDAPTARQSDLSTVSSATSAQRDLAEELSPAGTILLLRQIDPQTSSLAISASEAGNQPIPVDENCSGAEQFSLSGCSGRKQPEAVGATSAASEQVAPSSRSRAVPPEIPSSVTAPAHPDTMGPSGHSAEAIPTVSRRMFMSTASIAAAATIVASPSVAAAIPSPSTTEADIELIRLGAQFDRLRDIHTVLNAEAIRLLTPMHERFNALRHDRAAFEVAWEDEKKKEPAPGLREVTASLDELWKTLDSLLDTIMGARPASFSGVAVKLRALRWFLDIDDEEPGADQDLDLEHRWLNIIDRDVRHLAAAETSPIGRTEPESNGDPVFTAIDAEKLAWNNFVRYLRQPDEARSRSREAELSDLHDDAADDLYHTPPRTRAGHTALINHVIRMIELDCDSLVDEDPFYLTGSQLITLLRGLQISSELA